MPVTGCESCREGPFHFSRKVNIGALHSTGEHLLFLNDDTEVITPDWIESMMLHAAEKDVGAVGAKLYFADGRIQHAGVAANVAPSHVYYAFRGTTAATPTCCGWPATTSPSRPPACSRPGPCSMRSEGSH